LKNSGGQCAELLVCETKDAAKPMCRLKVGQWSEKLTRKFKTQQGEKKAAFQFKLLELSAEGAEVKLFLSPLCSLSGFTHPAALADELAQLSPMPWPNFGYEEMNREWVDDETHLEIMKANHDYMCAAADYLLTKKPWDLFCTHLHCPDWAYHAFGKRLDPLTSPDPKLVSRFERLELEFNKQMDRYFGTLLKYAGEDTLVVIVSDHGAQTTTGHVPIGKLLADAGLTVYKPKKAGQPGPPEIDWSKSKAAVQRSCYIYVNLKGRDPHGIVAQGKEYNEVREAIIKALYDYVDPELKIKPVVFALRSEDARVIGLYGNRIGDVVFAVREERCGQHGPVLPTAKFGVGSIEGLFIMAGPGIKKGAELERNVWLVDVVPTVCHLAEWPIPKQAEGAILYQAFEDPDQEMHELERCRKNYERLERTFEAEKQLTHSYNR
jgi:predicted AlkP superfamily phosphohydrolase/phosphomutase